ncbi:MAG: aminopeptidase [Promethearchaeota archaeon]
MSSEFEQNLEKYAEVILKVGVNLQKGQRLIIIARDFGTSLLDLAPFIKIIGKRAYQLGARFVEVIWNEPQLHLIRLQYAPRNSFEEFSTWKRDAILDFIKKGDALLSILASDPQFFSDQDPELLTNIIRTRRKQYKTVSDLLNQKKMINSSIITPPTDGWAKKVFPDLPLGKRTARLWDKIFDICHIKQKDPISAWNDHIKQLDARCEYLNKKQYQTLKLNAPGTDLKVGLPKGHIWNTASMTSQTGISYIPNLPTEEIFTLPHKDKTEGTVKMTKPRNYEGYLIKDIEMTFSKGKVIELKAVNGKDLLEKIVKSDEGASRLGEIALIPHTTPVSQSGLIFYNGLIDENASNHIALGFAYRSCLKNGIEMSDEEFMVAGGNTSLIHIDFMIGSGGMDVDGILENGTSEPIMRKGEWAF